MKIHQIFIIGLLLSVLMTGCGDDNGKAGGGSSARVPLGETDSFVVLSKTGITDTPTSAITGDVGASPASGASIGVTCAEVTGTIFSIDAAGPAPCSQTAAGFLTTVMADMDSAYANAAGRTPAFTDEGGGNIDGLTLSPGVHNWTTGVSIPTNVTLSGGPNDIWIFQIAQDLSVADSAVVTLSGGAQPQNIFWQVAGAADIGSGAQFEGILLSQTSITVGAGAVVNGRLFAQSDVNLNSSTVTHP